MADSLLTYPNVITVTGRQKYSNNKENKQVYSTSVLLASYWVSTQNYAPLVK